MFRRTASHGKDVAVEVLELHVRELLQLEVLTKCIAAAGRPLRHERSVPRPSQPGSSKPNELTFAERRARFRRAGSAWLALPASPGCLSAQRARARAHEDDGPSCARGARARAWFRRWGRLRPG